MHQNSKILLAALLVVVAISGTARAQTPSRAPSASVEPSIAFGLETVMALRSNGDVLTWGNQFNKCLLGRKAALGKVDPNPGVVMHNVKEVATAAWMHLAVTVDGKVYGWGAGLPMGSKHYPCDGPALVPSLAG